MSAVAWSPTRPCVIAAGTDDGGGGGGGIAVFDLFASTDVAAAEKLPRGGAAAAAVTALAFHPRGENLAAGDALGGVAVFVLPLRLAGEQRGEARALARWLRGGGGGGGSSSSSS